MKKWAEFIWIVICAPYLAQGTNEALRRCQPGREQEEEAAAAAQA